MARRKPHRRPGMLPVRKYVGGKLVREYVNLAVFNRTCSKRGSWRSGRACELRNLRCGRGRRFGGLATVDTYRMSPHQGGEHKETWLLDFADCSILKRHLQGRVVDPGGKLR